MVSSGVFDDFQLRVFVHFADHGLHPLHDPVFEQVLTAPFALQHRQLLENHDCLLARLERQVRDDRPHLTTANMALHDAAGGVGTKPQSAVNMDNRSGFGLVQRFANRGQERAKHHDVVAWGAKQDDGESGTRQVLLVLQVTINGQKDIKFLFSEPQQGAVLDAGQPISATVLTS